MGCLEDDIDFALREVRRKTRVYVATSWRNEHQPKIVERLGELGFDVYDFRKDGFGWNQIDVHWHTWTPAQYLNALKTSQAQHGFERDFNAMKWCDVCVFVMPCGPSASMEMGWCVGAGKHVLAYIPNMREPDLMVKMAHQLEENWLMIEHHILQFHKWRTVTTQETRRQAKALHDEYPCDCGFC